MIDLQTKMVAVQSGKKVLEETQPSMSKIAALSETDRIDRAKSLGPKKDCGCGHGLFRIPTIKTWSCVTFVVR
ncbi:hypothetical protein OXX69_011048 [Metschnikowia pulcherrima]